MKLNPVKLALIFKFNPVPEEKMTQSAAEEKSFPQKFSWGYTSYRLPYLCYKGVSSKYVCQLLTIEKIFQWNKFYSKLA